jgi:hypothetical protein
MPGIARSGGVYRLPPAANDNTAACGRAYDQSQACAQPLTTIGVLPGFRAASVYAGLGEAGSANAKHRSASANKGAATCFTGSTTRARSACLRCRRRSETLLPHCYLAGVGPAHDLSRPAAVCGEQNELRPPNVLLGAVPIRHNRRKVLAVSGTQFDSNTRAQAPDSHSRASARISISRTGLPGIQRSKLRWRS